MYLSSFRPFSKEIERIFENIARFDRAYVDDSRITRNLPRKYPNLFDKDNGYFEIYYNKRHQRSVILPRNGLKCMPLVDPDSDRIRLKNRTSKKFGIFRVF